MLEISDLVWHDEVPRQPPLPPLACRLRLWHRWTRVVLDCQHSYVVCRWCQRLPARTIFEPPVP